MFELISINSFKSTFPGGVESLIRNFKLLPEFNNKNLLEYYKWDSEQGIYPESKNTKYVQYGSGAKGGVFFSRLSLFWAFLKLNPVGKTIVIFHLSDLLSIPSRVRKKNRIVVVQTNRFDIYLTGLAKLALKFFYKDISIFSVYTDMDRARLSEMYTQISPVVRVIPRGCRIPVSASLAPYGKKLVTIARLDEKQKNLQEMARIVEGLPAGYSLDIYGDGSEEEVQLIKSLSKESDRISFLGPAVNIVEVLSKYSIFLMTSVYEGFGQTLIEARSQGLPVV